MRNANLPEFFGTRPNSVKSQTTASMRSGHGKGEYAPRGALCGGAGQMGSNDLLPYAPFPHEGKLSLIRPGGGAFLATCSLQQSYLGHADRAVERTTSTSPMSVNPATSGLSAQDRRPPLRGPDVHGHGSAGGRRPPGRTGRARYTGEPASGAGSRCTSCVTGCSCADDDGSAEPGSGAGDDDSGGGSGVGSAVVREGLGSPPGGTESADGLPPFSVAFPDGFPSADADAEADAPSDADSPASPGPSRPSRPCHRAIRRRHRPARPRHRAPHRPVAPPSARAPAAPRRRRPSCSRRRRQRS